MVSLARRSTLGRQDSAKRRGEKWRTGIFFTTVVGKDREMASFCFPRSLLPLSSVLILSVLPLQIPEGSQLLGWARDAAFPGSRILGGQGWASQGLQVPRAGGSSWSISQGGRVVEKSLGEEKGRERRKRRVERKVRVALPSSQPRAKQWSSPVSQKAGQSPREHRSPPDLFWLLPQLRVCPSCWKWNEAQFSPCWGPMSAQS